MSGEVEVTVEDDTAEVVEEVAEALAEVVEEAVEAVAEVAEEAVEAVAEVATDTGAAGAGTLTEANALQEIIDRALAPVHQELAELRGQLVGAVAVTEEAIATADAAIEIATAPEPEPVVEDVDPRSAQPLWWRPLFGKGKS